MRKRLIGLLFFIVVGAGVVWWISRSSGAPLGTSLPAELASVSEEQQLPFDRSAESSPDASRAERSPDGATFEITVTRAGATLVGAEIRVYERHEDKVGTAGANWQRLGSGITSQTPLSLPAGHGIHFLIATVDGLPVAWTSVARRSTELHQLVHLEAGTGTPVTFHVEGARDRAVLLSLQASFSPTLTASLLPQSEIVSLPLPGTNQLTMSLSPGHYLVTARTGPAVVSTSFHVPEQREVTLVIPERSSIFGRVLDPDGGPRSGVDVIDWNVEDTRPQSLTDPSGAFELEVGPGLHRIGAQSGSTAATSTLLTIDGGARLGPVVLTLGAQVTLQGQVFNERNHAPIARAQVSVSASFVEGEFANEVTDADGHWQATVPAGTVDIVVGAPGFFGANHTEVEMRHPGTFTYDIGLTENASVDGRVLTAAGAPVVGATVEFSWSTSAFPATRGRDVTGPTGRFELNDVPAEGGNLVVTPAGGKSFHHAIKLKPGERQHVDVIVPGRLFLIRGTIVLPSSHVTEATVSAFTETDARSVLAVHDTFTLEVPAGTWTLVARHHGATSTYAEVTVDDDPSSAVALTFPPGPLRVAHVQPRAPGLKGDVGCAAASESVDPVELSSQGLAEVPADVTRCFANTNQGGGVVTPPPGTGPFEIPIDTASLELTLVRGGRLEPGPCEVMVASHVGDFVSYRTVIGGTAQLDGVPRVTQLSLEVTCPDVTTRSVSFHKPVEILTVELGEMGEVQVEVRSIDGSAEEPFLLTSHEAYDESLNGTARIRLSPGDHTIEVGSQAWGATRQVHVFAHQRANVLLLVSDGGVVN